MRPFYRRSVWLDVASVVGLLVLLLAPIAYLAVSTGPGSLPRVAAEARFGSGLGSEDGPVLATRDAASGGSPSPAPLPTGWGEEDRSATGEAKRLAGKMRALSEQLGQMQGGATAASVQGRSDASAPSELEAPNRRETGSPSNVSIGDHLHWLVVAGVLWGAWRIGHGA